MTLAISRRCFQAERILKKTWTAFLASKHHRFQSSSADDFAISKADPGKHTINDLGSFYTIPNSLSLDVLFKDKVFEKNFREMCVTFGATDFLLRYPAWEIIQYLKSANYQNPINRYLIYGKFGCGKTTTLAQVIHYAHLSGWIVLHVPQAFDWINSTNESTQSEIVPEVVDLPTDGSMWLSRFKSQNEALINSLDLRLQNNYKWNVREEQSQGESLMSLVNFGISRSKYSCDVITGLVEEVKSFSKTGKVKTLVAIKGVNAMFEPKTKIKCRSKFVTPDELSIIKAFKNLIRPDWHNGAAVLTCYVPQLSGDEVENYYPMQLLTTKGFEFLDPFIPIEVPLLTDSEMTSLLDYYRSKKWLLTSDGDGELKFLSGGNAYVLQKLTSPL